MRRLRSGIGIALLLLVPEVTAAAICESAGSGNWTNPAVWTWCGGGLPGPVDSVIIHPPHEIVYDANTPSGDTLFDMLVEAGATLRFPVGDHRLQVGRTDIFGFQVEGRVSVANGAVIAFNSTTDYPGFVLGNAAEFDSDGVALGPLRKADGFSIPGPTAGCGGTDEWRVQTSSSLAGLGPGDLLQFATGSAQGRMYEVMSASAGVLVLCPNLPDSLSRGPRLTPHAPTLALFQPGTFPVQIPAAGDQFWAWHPWRVLKAGPNNWFLDENNPPAQENHGRFEWVGGDISGFGPLDWSAIGLICGPGRPPVQFRHNNLHDHGGGIGLFSGPSMDAGCDRPNFTWNVVHDGDVSDAYFHFGVLRTSLARVSGGVIAWNTFYRTSHNTIQVNAVGATDPLIGFDVAYNTGFDLGTSASGECEFIETDLMAESTVQFNRGWRISQGCGGISAKPSDMPAAFTGNLYRGNYLQGGHLGIDLSSIQDLYHGNAMVGNYVADSYQYSMRGWAAYANVLRRWAEGNVEDGMDNRYALFAVEAEGNFLDGAGSARASQGIVLADRGWTGIPSRVRNNAVRGLATVLETAACLTLADSYEAHSAAILHNVCDCDSGADCFGVLIRQGFAPLAPATIDLDDNVVFDLQTSPIASGSAARNDSLTAVLSAGLDRLTRWPSGSLGAVGVWSPLVGEAVRNPHFVNPDGDFNYLPSSAERTAGGNPPGSSIGIRYLRFDTDLFPSFLLTAMTLPVTVANDTLGDADADGVPDDVDGCPATPDAVRRDADLDGIGDACDPCVDADSDGFGSPISSFSTCGWDNCPAAANPNQWDINNDGEGDACDPVEGRIVVTLPDRNTVAWSTEAGNNSYDLYRGSLATLRATGEYTQDPATVPGASRTCGMIAPPGAAGADPGPGQAYFYLVTAVRNGVEGELGNDAAGHLRANSHPCP